MMEQNENGITSDRGDETDRLFPWHLGVYDAHCHPTDLMHCVKDISKIKARVLTIMATRGQDQELVSQVAEKMSYDQKPLDCEDRDKKSCQVIPSFGWHPWFTHQLYDDLDQNYKKLSKIDHYQSVLAPSPEDGAFVSSLPEPKPLSEYLKRTKEYLLKHPLALVGEIGLDRDFRIPISTEPSRSDEAEELTPGGREGRRLSPHRVRPAHQQKILKAQLNLARDMSRAVSVHGVGAHGLLFETLQETWKGHETAVGNNHKRKRRASVAGAHDHEDTEDTDDGTKIIDRGPKPYPPRICLHSFSGPPDLLKQYLNPAIPSIIFFSFSQVINFSTPASAKAVEVIKALPEDRILVESDLHCAGERMDNLLEEMVRSICQIRGWGLEDGVRRLARNWRHFALGQF